MAALEEQFEERKTIERAKGILMDRNALSEGDAFRFMQRSAMSGRRRMIDIAREIVEQ